MALNCVMLSQQHAPIPLPGPSAGSEETEVARVPLSAAVELLLEIPVVPPSGNGTAGGSGGAKKLQSTGWIWLSDQRVRISIKTTSILDLSIDAYHTVRFHKRSGKKLSTQHAIRSPPFYSPDQI